MVFLQNIIKKNFNKNKKLFVSWNNKYKKKQWNWKKKIFEKKKNIILKNGD